jgi:phage shock protein B
MTAVLIVGIVFGSIIALFAIIFGFVVAMAKVKRGSSFRGGEHLQAEEARLIQELHRGLSRMEERVEALETIMLDQEGKKEKKGDGT